MTDMFATENAVIAALQAEGITATLEHPGYLLIMDWSGNRDAAIGTVNGYWGGDLVTRADGDAVDTLPLNVPLTTAPADVARAIVAAWKAAGGLEVFILAAHGREIIAEVDTLDEAIEEARRLFALDSTHGVQITRRRR